MLHAIDIETKCAHSCEVNCEHALDPFHSIITCVGVYAFDVILGETFHYFTDLNDFRSFIERTPDAIFTGQNLKWDLKQLSHHGVLVPIERWQYDSQLMAAAYTQKIPESWLKKYEEKRELENKKLKRGYSHREGTLHSLKTLAPYFLGVAPFWENPEEHMNKDYVFLDCKYSYRLTEFFRDKLKDENTYNFFRNHLLPWTKMLLEAEMRGITIDMQLLQDETLKAKVQSTNDKMDLDFIWKDGFEKHYEKEKEALHAEYAEKYKKALAKTPHRKEHLTLKYKTLFEKAAEKIEGFNLDSPTQMAWLLGEHFGLDLKNYKGKVSTGEEVLQRLSSVGREDIAKYLQYRKNQKLATAFFPSYRELQQNSVIHTSFNPTGTRTGRLSSSSPNLQQVPAHLHSLFKARSGRLLLTRDLSNIEPIIIAYFTEDKTLCEIVLRGMNIHDVNTILMFGVDCDLKDVKEKYPNERAVAKTVGLALFYGAQEFRIQHAAQQAGFSWGIGHCKHLYDTYKKSYAEVFAFKEELDRMALNEPIKNLFGRKHRYTPREIMMKTFNTLVQSSASDLLLNATYKANEEFKELGIDAYPLLWVHDETVFEIPEDKKEICEKIVEKHLLGVTLKVSAGSIPLKCEGKTLPIWSK